MDATRTSAPARPHSTPGTPPVGADPAAAVGHASEMPRDLPRIGTVAVMALVLVIAALLGGLFVIGYRPYVALHQNLAAEVLALDAPPVVEAARPQRQEAAFHLLLPADVQSYQETSVYPRANGYLKRLGADIGDRVKAGQVLAEIDAPELDAQLSQARADVQQAQAQIEKVTLDAVLARTTLRRYEGVEVGGVSKQQVDEKRTQLQQAEAGLNLARASLASSQAEVQRLEALLSFKNVAAPFSGVVTERNYDVGALLSATTAGSGSPLFRVEQTDLLRVFVQVPQAHAESVAVGLSVKLSVRNHPGRTFEGKVTRSAGAINTDTRTLRVQAEVPNPDGLLLAGMYGQVSFPVVQNPPPLMIPTSALVYNAEGLSVAVVLEGKAHYRQVTVGRDLGMQVEVLTGLTGDELVIGNPGERIREGTTVQVVAPRDKNTAATRPSRSESRPDGR